MKEKNENGCERNFKEDFPKNCLGELSNSSYRRRTHDCYEKITQQFTAEGCPIYLLGLGMGKGVSEGSRSGKG